MNPIYIVGYMGAGKSTLGRKLALELGLGFIDTDIFIENRFRERIVDMFASIGEESFRRRERYVIEELSGMTNCVISTGGGLPCFYDNMSLLNATGLTVYLYASDDVLAERLEYCKRTRPTIKDKTGEELLAYIQSAMQVRRAIYEQAKLHISIEGVNSSEEEQHLAQELAKTIKCMCL